MSGESLTGTGEMLRLILRRDRIRLPVWVLATVGVIYASADAVQGLYSTPEDLRAYAETVGSSPAAIFMSGPPTALTSMGGVTVFEVNFVAIIAIGLMAVFSTIRHTRADEEAGRGELLRATVLGQLAPAAATGVVVSAASVLIGAGAAVSFLSLGLPAAGSLIYGASLAATGVVFTFVALVVAQVMEHGRAALAVSVAVLAGSFVLRGAGDVGSKVLSWISPIGWAQATHAFGENRVWPLAVPVAAFVVLGWTTVALLRRRDLGAGLVAPRLGRARATPGLRSLTSLAVRMQRGSVLGWVSGLFLLGVAFGSLGQEMTEIVEGNSQVRELIGGGSGQRIVDSFFATALRLQALLAAGFAVGSVLRLRGAERAGQAELLLTTGRSRPRWASSWLLVTGIGAALMVAAGGVGLGLAHSVTTGDFGELPQLAGAAFAYLPAVLLLGGLAALLLGWFPTTAIASWAVLAACFVVGWLGQLLGLPGWLIDLSPFEQVPQLPMDELAWGPIVLLSAVVVAFAALTMPGVRRRDIG